MKNSTLIIFVISSLLSCTGTGIVDPPFSFDLDQAPIVLKTDRNYSEDEFRTSFPDTISWKAMRAAYDNNFNNKDRQEILSYIIWEAENVGEDGNIIKSILQQTGCYETDGFLLPTFAERTKYEDVDVWIIQIIRGNGKPVFSHFKCFAISSSGLDTLAYTGCR